MKRYIFLIVFTMLLSVKSFSQSSAPEKQAKGIAQFFSDSLHVSKTITDSIYSISLFLGNQKRQAWNVYNNQDSLTIRLQQIEDMRDELYRPLLDSTNFHLYLKRKNELLHAY